MPWFRLDDSFHSHPKVIAAGNEAIGLYVRCGTYAAEHLTDGFIREDIAVLYGACDTGSRRNPGTGEPETLAETLVRTKLWRRARKGWRMPDYLEYNPSREAVDNERQQKAERQKRWREKHGPRHNRDILSARSTKSGDPVDNPVAAENARSGTRGRRVTNPSHDASKDGAPTRPAPKEAGRSGTAPNARETPCAANGRAGPPGPAAHGAGPPPKPAWCGHCDELTRQIGEDSPARCPTCHPHATGMQAQAWRAATHHQETPP